MSDTQNQPTKTDNQADLDIEGVLADDQISVEKLSTLVERDASYLTSIITPSGRAERGYLGIVFFITKMVQQGNQPGLEKRDTLLRHKALNTVVRSELIARDKKPWTTEILVKNMDQLRAQFLGKDTKAATNIRWRVKRCVKFLLDVEAETLNDDVAFDRSIKGYTSMGALEKKITDTEKQNKPDRPVGSSGPTRKTDPDDDLLDELMAVAHQLPGLADFVALDKEPLEGCPAENQTGLALVTMKDNIGQTGSIISFPNGQNDALMKRVKSALIDLLKIGLAEEGYEDELNELLQGRK